MTYDIKPEWAKAWRWLSHARDYLHGSHNADNMLHCSDLSVHLLAGWMRERFERTHTMRFQGNCAGCMIRSQGYPDPGHDYGYEDWCAEARKELGK